MAIHLLPAIPHLLIMLMVCVTLLLTVFLKSNALVVYYLVQLTLLLSLYFSWWVYSGHTQWIFSHSFVSTHLSMVLNMFINALVFVAFIYSRSYVRAQQMPDAEYYIMGLLATLGMMVLVSSASLLTLYLGLELLALSTYVMVAMQRHCAQAIEAGMKYFVTGAIASGFLLYGMSMVFGLTHSLDLKMIAAMAWHLEPHGHPMLMLGLVFLLAGIAFKLGAAPFHMWVVDVFDGAPTSTTLLIATAPKVAAFALIFRLLMQALPALHVAWQPLLIVIAIVSMALGNIGALTQTHLKRLLAYSSIAHMGYFILGLACNTIEGFGAALFYLISYILMTLAAFGLITLLSHTREITRLEDLTGLNTHNPWLAFVMLLVMFSMAGIPPLVGFIAKLGIIEALIQAHQVGLAVLMIIFAILGVYYYLHVVKVMYFGAAKEKAPLYIPLDGRIVISLNGLALLLLGLFPQVLLSWCYWLSTH